MKKIALYLVVFITCLFITACSGGASTGQDSGKEAPSAESQSAVISYASSESAAEPDLKPNVLSEILDCKPDEIAHFTYFDLPKLYQRDSDGAVFPANGAQDITYSCGSSGEPYISEEAAYMLELAQALREFQVDTSSEVIRGDVPLPSGRYFTVWPDLKTDWNPVLTFFDSGEIYVDFNGKGDGSHRRWFASDPTNFDDLKAVLEGIHAGLDSLPLDYQVEFWLSPDNFKPESKALRFGFDNKGSKVITAQALSIERKEGDSWQPIGEATASDLEIVSRSYTRYAVDLTKITGAQQPGTYRVKTELKADSEALPLELEYTIDENASDMSNPLLPKMTPENQEYCDRYVSVWGFYSPFKEDFNEQNYIKEFHTYHLYYMLSYAEGARDELDKAYGIDVPADIVEGTIMRHFLFFAEQIRANTPSKAQGGSEYYDPATDTYHFEGGYGGGGSSAVVKDSHMENDILTLAVDWYGMDDGYESSQELVLRLGNGEHDFMYIAGSAPQRQE